MEVEGQRNQRHIGQEDEDCREEVEEGYRDEAVEEVEDGVGLRLDAIEIVGVGIEAKMTHGQIDQENEEGQPESHADGSYKITEGWGVNPEAAQCNAAEEDHEMGDVEADHSGQEDAVIGEADTRHQKCHQCPKGSDKEAKAREGTALCEDGNGDEDRIDVAKMQRKLLPPAKAAFSGFGHDY